MHLQFSVPVALLTALLNNFTIFVNGSQKKKIIDKRLNYDENYYTNEHEYVTPQWYTNNYSELSGSDQDVIAVIDNQEVNSESSIQKSQEDEQPDETYSSHVAPSPANIATSGSGYSFLTSLPIIGSLTHSLLGGGQHSVRIIKPGTKWCGDGNKARNYHDVGLLYKTDRCCRSHDKCPISISTQQTKYGLYNDAPFTRSHCDCDSAFYDCLKRASSPFSAGVGITYFNVLKMKCFRLEYPTIGCTHTSGWLSNHCSQYIVDTSKEKVWQWFNNLEF